MNTEQKNERRQMLDNEAGTEITVLGASAGSGKTFNLAYRFIRRILRNPELFHEILAVTFTNMATCQMKDKILESLDKLKKDPGNSDYSENLMFDLNIADLQVISNLAAEAQMNILADYDRFSVSTIDKFFSRVVRGFFNELGKDPSYRVVTSSGELIDRAIIDVICNGKNSELLKPLFEQRTGQDGKNYNIREDLSTISGAILKLHDVRFDAPAIRHQIQTDIETVRKNEEKIFAKAAEILSYMMPPAGPTMDDYAWKSKGIAGHIRKWAAGETEDNGFKKNSYFDKVVNGEKAPSDFKGKHGDYIKEIELRLTADLSGISELIDKFNEKYSRMANTAELVGKKVNMLEAIDVIYRQYLENCKASNMVAINEMPALVGEVASNADLNFLYMKIGILLTSIMIDEFQDTSNEQWEGFRPIFEEICSRIPNPENLIIGDIKQAIYRWRGGEESLLRNKVREEFRTFDGTLKENYRSLQKIIEFNNALYGYISETGISSDDFVFEGKEEIREEIDRIIGETYRDATQNVGKPKDQEGGYVECIFNDEEAEAMEALIGKINTEIIPSGFSWNDIAIITRENSEATKVADALARAGIPFVSAESLFLENSHFVKMMVALMHIAVKPEDEAGYVMYNLLRYELTNERMKALSDAACMSSDKALKHIAKVFGLSASDCFAVSMQPVSADDRKINLLMQIAKSPDSDVLIDEYDILCISGIKDRIEEEKLDALSMASTMSLVEAVMHIQLTMNLYPYEGETAYADSFMGTVYSKYSESFSLSDFVAWWDETGKKTKLTSPEGLNAVSIVTIHKSKGLEYPIVMVPYLNWKFIPKTGSLLMLQADNGCPYGKFGKLPLEFSEKKLYNSDFKDAYLSEIKQSIIDNLNLLYVTTTRAKERLYVICPKKPDNKSVAGFIKGFTEWSGTTTWGNPDIKKSKQREVKPACITEDISPTPFRKKLTGSESGSFSNLNKHKGILMHEAMSQIHSLDELRDKVSHLSETRGIPFEQFETIVDRILRRPEIREWFNPRWTVFTERGIMIPGEDNGRRPDRVMIDEKRAVVVDYKFGELENKDYVTQVQKYMSLLGMMGYTDISGYIYYVTTDRIVPCSLTD